MNRTSGLIVFDGIEGSGKSTLSRAFSESLGQRGQRTKLMAFPSHHGEVGKLIRRSFVGEAKLDREQEVLAYLLMADCLERQREISDAISDGVVVVADRYAPVTSWAYQLEVMGVDKLLAIQQRDQFIQPALTVIIDVNPDEAMRRLAIRGPHRYSTSARDVEHLERLAGRYLAYAALHAPNARMLDGTLSTEEQVDAVHDALDSFGDRRTA